MAPGLFRYALRLTKHRPSLIRGLATWKTARECLEEVPQTQVSALKNGFRVATENTGLPTTTVGVWVEAGSRFEHDDNNGVGNFWEHMAFRGTNKRSQTEFENELEKLGAQIKAYTSREVTAFYAKCLSKDTDKVVELLADMILNPKLADGDIEKERGIILNQLAESDQNIQEVAMDYTHAAAFQGTPLARPVLGKTENIAEMKRKDIVEYLEDNYKASRMVLAAAGGMDHGHLVELGQKFFGNVNNTYPREVPTIDTCRFTGSELQYHDDSLPHAYGVLAFEGVGLDSPDRIPLAVASAMLGQWNRTSCFGPNSPFALAQHVGWEKDEHDAKTLAYDAFNVSYKNDGLWGLYFVCEEAAAADFIDNIIHEMKHLCVKCKDEEVQMGKNYLKTQLLTALDGTTPVADDIGRQVIIHGQRVPTHELLKSIDQVTAEDVQNACTNYVYDRDVTFVSVGRVTHFPSYLEVRKRMSWWRM